MVTPKKYLGQHFLRDENIARKIAEIPLLDGYEGDVLEIGPGTGVLTKYLMAAFPRLNLKVCEIDKESIIYLNNNYPKLKVIDQDFLKLDIGSYFENEVYIIGNFPYNISSQIVFQILDFRDRVPAAAGMFQKEMAERIAAKHGGKDYGILSVLTQSYYNVDYLFTVHEHVFNPPPKVKSGVIKLTRKENPGSFSPGFLKTIVKAAFNQRRKTLRNSLSAYIPSDEIKQHPVFNKRPEQLSVAEFHELSNMMQA